MFSDATYGSIDFQEIDYYLRNTFSYVDAFSDSAPALGKSYVVGTDKQNVVKIDFYYTDAFIQPSIIADKNIRLATIEEIIAMKVDVVQRGGSKEDFWDLHAVLELYGIKKMLELHDLRYQYDHDEKLIIKNFTNFKIADEDFDPVCLHGKYWDFIKDDFEVALFQYKKL